MLNLVAYLIATLLDPFRLILSFLGTWLSSKKWHLIVSSLIGAFLLEISLTCIQETRVFGEGLLKGWLASLLQVFLIFCILKKVKGRQIENTDQTMNGIR